MTAVIVQFKPNFSVNQITARKRAASVSSADVGGIDKTKRAKTDTEAVIEEKEEEPASVTTS